MLPPKTQRVDLVLLATFLLESPLVPISMNVPVKMAAVLLTLILVSIHPALALVYLCVPLQRVMSTTMVNAWISMNVLYKTAVVLLQNQLFVTISWVEFLAIVLWATPDSTILFAWISMNVLYKTEDVILVQRVPIHPVLAPVPIVRVVIREAVRVQLVVKSFHCVMQL
jgi:hypothetical protein